MELLTEVIPLNKLGPMGHYLQDYNERNIWEKTP